MQMSRICIIALIGLPAAGKTTFCQELLKLPELPYNLVHICFDSFLKPHTLHAEQQVSEFNFKAERSRIMAVLQSLVNAFKLQSPIPHDIRNKINITLNNTEDYVIICDDNNYYLSMRYELYQVCKANQLNFGQIYFSIDATLALHRNSERHEKVPRHIVQQMSTRLQAPNAQKNKWESLTLVLDFDFKSFPTLTVLEFIVKVFEQPQRSDHVVGKQVQLQPFSPSHYLDVLLRRRIKEILNSESSAAAKQNKAISLNDQRKEILRTFKVSDSTSLEELDVFSNILH